MRIVIAGAGEVGQYLAGRLSQGRNDVVVVDQDASALAHVEETLDVQVLLGDAASRAVLRRAEVAGAQAVIAVSGSGDANVLSAALGRAMGARVAVARVDDPRFYEVTGGSERGVLGIDHVLCTTRLTAADLLTQMARTRAPFVHTFAAGSLQVALWKVEADQPAAGRSPRDVALAPGAALGGVVRDLFLRRPEESTRLEPGDALLLTGTPRSLAASFVRLAGERRAERHVVVGGSEIGAILAGELCHRRHRIELVEADKGRCQALAAELDGVSVLQGDPTDLDFLRDIRFEEADSVIAVTSHEEVNLLTTLLVRQLDRTVVRAVPHTFVSVHRPGYADLCRRLGIEGISSSFEVLSRSVLEAIAPHGIVCHEPLPGLAWTIAHVRFAEALVPDTVLGDVPLPSGATVLGVTRDGAAHAAVPHLELVGGDELIVSAATRDLPQLERAVQDARRRGTT